MDTRTVEYAEQLFKKQLAWWKILLGLQIPYRWNLKRLKPRFVLDIGCGLGRNLVHLGGNGVGIDSNIKLVELARARGLEVFTPSEFKKSPFNIPERFDSILLAHVAEHMIQKEVVELLNAYLYLLKLEGRLILIVPQEAGYRSDASHIEFMDFTKLRDIYKQVGFVAIKEYSFPFPRVFGNIFYFNEFISVSKKLKKC